MKTSFRIFILLAFNFVSFIISGNKVSAAITVAVSHIDVSSDYFNGDALFYNGSVTGVATGGVAPYTYELNTLYLNNNGYFPGLPAGSYIVKVTDATGQTISAPVSVSNIYPLPVLDSANIIFPSSCNSSDGAFTLTGTGGTPPYQYSIDGGVTFSANFNFTGLRQGMYIGILKDANGMLAVCKIFPPAVSEHLFFSCSCCSFVGFVNSYGVNSCDNTGFIQAQPDPVATPPYYVSGTPPYQYSLDGINYYPQTYNSGTYSYTFNNLAPGLYTVYIKDANGNLYISRTSVTKLCKVRISFVAVDASCGQSDGSLTITATGGVAPYLYTMDGTNFQTSNTFTGLAAGTYTYSIKDASGLITSAGATVFNKCPVITATETDDSCAQAKGTIHATGIKGTRPYGFSIDRLNYQSDSVFQGLLAGDYTVYLKDANGYMDSTTVTVRNNCLHVTVATVNETCGNPDGSITATGNGGTPPYLYSVDGINFQSSGYFSGLAAGIYPVTVKDVDQLVSSVTDTVKNIPGPSVTVTATTASCSGNGATITVTATSGTLPFVYSIDGMNYQAGNIFNGVVSGSHIIKTMDNNACVVNDTVMVSKYPSPVVFLGNDTALCVGEKLLLVAHQNSSAQYLWQDGTTADAYMVSAPGLYYVMVTNQFNCSASDSIQVSYKPLPQFSLGNDTTLCTGQMLKLTVKLPGAAFLWNTGSTNNFLDINSPGLYWLKLNNNNCTAADSIMVVYNVSPVVNLGNDTSICEGNTYLLSAGNPGATYLWQDGATTPGYLVSHEGYYQVTVDRNNCTATGSVHIVYNKVPVFTLGPDLSICNGNTIVLNPGITGVNYLWQDGKNTEAYTVTQPGLYYLTASNTCGSLTDSVLVTKGNCNLYIPNSFTPNGDGLNDLFKPDFGNEVTGYRLQVFNRYGQPVFLTTDKNKGWDGTFAGINQPAGVYVWFLQYRFLQTMELKKLQGTVLLMH